MLIILNKHMVHLLIEAGAGRWRTQTLIEQI
jgi:hypothetical protein